MTDLLSRLREIETVVRGIARQIVSPPSVREEWLNRAATLRDAANEIERLWQAMNCNNAY